jgi:hypothetical protein
MAEGSRSRPVGFHAFGEQTASRLCSPWDFMREKVAGEQQLSCYYSSRGAAAAAAATTVAGAQQQLLLGKGCLPGELRAGMSPGMMTK